MVNGSEITVKFTQWHLLQNCLPVDWYYNPDMWGIMKLSCSHSVTHMIVQLYKLRSNHLTLQRISLCLGTKVRLMVELCHYWPWHSFEKTNEIHASWILQAWSNGAIYWQAVWKQTTSVWKQTTFCGSSQWYGCDPIQKAMESYRMYHLPRISWTVKKVGVDWYILKGMWN